MRWIVLLLVPLAGCISEDVFDECDPHDSIGYPEPDTVQERTICVHEEWERRDLVVHYPAEPDGAPLIIALHGGGGNAANMADKTRLHEAVPDAIVVYPQGTPAGEAGFVRTWNAMHCCGKAYERSTNDVAFIASIIEELDRVSPSVILITGHSNGGMMAHRFAAEHAELVDILVPVAGTIGGRPTLDAEILLPTQPLGVDLAVHIIHATDDAHVPFAGGNGEDSVTWPRHDLSVAESRQFWEVAGATVEVIETVGGHGWPGDDHPRGNAPSEPDASALIAGWLP